MVERNREKILDAIHNAIKNNYLIFIRHHNDGDGFSAGLIAETVLSKLTTVNRKLIGSFSYNYTLMLKDLEELNKLKKIKKSNKVLFIIIDISMSKETLLSLKNLKKLANAEILVIDHHLIEDKDLFNKVIDYSYMNLNKNSGYLSYELFFSFFKKFNLLLNKKELAFLGFLKYLSVLSDSYYHLEEKLNLKLDQKIIEKNKKLFLLFEKIFEEIKGLNKSLESLFFIFENWELFNEDIKFLEEKLEKKIKIAKELIKKEDIFRILELEKFENFRDFPNPKIYLNYLVNKGEILIAFSEDLILLRAKNPKIDFRKLLIELKNQNMIGGAHKQRASFKVPKKKMNETLEFIKNYLKKQLEENQTN